MRVFCAIGWHRYSEFTQALRGVGYTSVREVCDRCSKQREQWTEQWKAGAL